VKLDVNSVEFHPQRSHDGASGEWCTGGVIAHSGQAQAPPNLLTTMKQGKTKQ